MKVWVLFTALATFVCIVAPSATASTLQAFDPTKEYTVHSVPVDLSQSVSITNTDKDQILNGQARNPRFALQDDTNGLKSLPFVSTPAHDPVPNSKAHDLSALTQKANPTKPTFWNAVSTRIKNTANKITNATKHTATTIKNTITTVATKTKAAIQTAAYRSVLALSNAANTFITTMRHNVSTYLQSVASNATTALMIAIGGPLLGILSKTTFGKQIIKRVEAFLVDGWVSMIDVVLHTTCAAASVFILLKTGSTLKEGYTKAKNWLTQKTGHDIGDFGHDLKVTVARVVLAVFLLSLPGLITATSASISTIAAETFPELLLRGSYAAQQTATECATIPTQCDSPTSTAITATSNFLFGIAPVNAKAQAKLVDEEIDVVTNSQVPAAIKPIVSNKKLSNIVENIYKGIDNPNRIGNGTTADAIKNEIRTGAPTFGTYHSKKGEETLRALKNWIRKNPNASSHDVEIATSELHNLENALQGK